MTTLRDTLMRELRAAAEDPDPYYDDRWRYPDRSRLRSKTELLRRRLIRADVFPSKMRHITLLVERLLDRADDWVEINAAFDHLEDDESRALFCRLLIRRDIAPALGRLPIDLPGYRKQVERLRTAVPTLALGGASPLEPTAVPIDLNPIGVDMRLRSHFLSVLNLFLLHQYELHRPGLCVTARVGDLCVDGGACWGDSSLYLADRVGPSGKVLAVECTDENIDVLQQNLDENPELGGRVDIIERALWSEDDLLLHLDGAGPGSAATLSSAPASGGVRTATIDRLGQQAGRPVDFVKLDVEGAEPDVIEGARHTIESHAPTLAVSVYHEPNHLITIVNRLAVLQPRYHFALHHVTTHLEETVLIAWTDQRA